MCCFLRLGFCGAYGLRGNLLNRHNHNRRTATSHKGGNAACMTREDHGRSNRSCFRCASQTCDVAGCRPVVFMAPRLDPKGASTRVPRLDVEPVASRCSFWVLPEKVQQSQAISQAPRALHAARRQHRSMRTLRCTTNFLSASLSDVCMSVSKSCSDSPPMEHHLYTEIHEPALGPYQCRSCSRKKSMPRIGNMLLAAHTPASTEEAQGRNCTGEARLA